MLANLAHEFRRGAALRSLFDKAPPAVPRGDMLLARQQREGLIGAGGGVRRRPAGAGSGSAQLAFHPQRPARGRRDSDHAVAPIIYIHGGGLVFYDVEFYGPWLRLLAERSGRTVYAIDYPKAPEVSPTEIRQAVARQYHELAERIGGPILLAGDSIGGLLALDLGRGGGSELDGILMICPVLNLRQERTFESYATYGEGYWLDRDFMDWFRGLAAAAVADFDPLAHIAHWPQAPVHVISAGCDLLRDEAIAFTSLHSVPGQDVRHTDLPGLPHDFWHYPAFRAVAEGLELIVGRHLGRARP